MPRFLKKTKKTSNKVSKMIFFLVSQLHTLSAVVVRSILEVMGVPWEVAISNRHYSHVVVYIRPQADSIYRAMRTEQVYTLNTGASALGALIGVPVFVRLFVQGVHERHVVQETGSNGSPPPAKRRCPSP